MRTNNGCAALGCGGVAVGGAIAGIEDRLAGDEPVAGAIPGDNPRPELVPTGDPENT